MENRDLKTNRAEYLFNEIKPALLNILREAPEYGTCGADVVLHQGRVTRVIVRCEIARKLPQGVK
jgi:hypothetical protein